MKPIYLAFLWHMHQPMYRLRGQSVCFMPWVRLHAVRAYYDMIRVLEEFPDMRVTMNLVPTMLEQLKAYETGGTDTFLEMGSLSPDRMGEVARSFLFENFFSAQPDRMVRPLPRYAELLRLRAQARHVRRAGEDWREFLTSDYLDLVALFNLSWCGFRAREDFPEIASLIKKGAGYTTDDIREIHDTQLQILRKIIPLYTAAAVRKQIEISVSPYAHPILPLLTNSESAREAMPKHPLPPPFSHPEDARRQIQDALSYAEQVFGFRPAGMWPSEGSLSQEVIEILASLQVSWVSTDEGLLFRSNREGPPNFYQVWNCSFENKNINVLFRDRELSDRIGFSYAQRDPKEAARDFLSSLTSRLQNHGDHNDFVLVALDGENPWEHYPNAGAQFLRALYSEITKQKEIVPVTVTNLLESVERRSKIHRLHAGSWINSDFGIWIGGPEKNRAWSILGRVRLELAPYLEKPCEPNSPEDLAWKSIRAAEGSDWFWWLDGQFASSYREQFDESFRNHLREAYEALSLTPPNFLEWFIPSTRILKEGVHGEPFEWVLPTVDGYESDMFEWHGAIELSWKSLTSGSNIQRAVRTLDSIRIGFSKDQQFFLRIDPEDSIGNAFSHAELELSFKCENRVRRIVIILDDRGDLTNAQSFEGSADTSSASQQPMEAHVKAVGRKVLEIAIPGEECGLRPDRAAVLILSLRSPIIHVRLREVRLSMPSEHSMIDAMGAQ